MNNKIKPLSNWESNKEILDKKEQYYLVDFNNKTHGPFSSIEEIQVSGIVFRDWYIVRKEESNDG